MDDALTGAGYRAKFAASDLGVVRFEDEGTPHPPSVGATVNYGFRGLWGVAATAQHTLGGWSGGYNPETGTAVSADLTSTEGAGLATREVGVVRAGVGPAYRHMTWEWSRGFCQCAGQQTTSGGALGIAGEALAELPHVSERDVVDGAAVSHQEADQIAAPHAELCGGELAGRAFLYRPDLHLQFARGRRLHDHLRIPGLHPRRLQRRRRLDPGWR